MKRQIERKGKWSLPPTAALATTQATTTLTLLFKGIRIRNFLWDPVNSPPAAQLQAWREGRGSSSVHPEQKQATILSWRHQAGLRQRFPVNPPKVTDTSQSHLVDSQAPSLCAISFTLWFSHSQEGRSFPFLFFPTFYFENFKIFTKVERIPYWTQGTLELFHQLLKFDSIFSGVLINLVSGGRGGSPSCSMCQFLWCKKLSPWLISS